MKEKFHVVASLMTVAISMLWAGPGQGQNTTSAPFQIVEATIDDIHMAFRSGGLTARQLAQGYLDRINAYDKQGPNINSIITINPNALAEADRREPYRDVGRLPDSACADGPDGTHRARSRQTLGWHGGVRPRRSADRARRW